MTALSRAGPPVDSDVASADVTHWNEPCSLPTPAINEIKQWSQGILNFHNTGMKFTDNFSRSQCSIITLMW